MIRDKTSHVIRLLGSVKNWDAMFVHAIMLPNFFFSISLFIYKLYFFSFLRLLAGWLDSCWNVYCVYSVNKLLHGVCRVFAKYCAWTLNLPPSSFWCIHSPLGMGDGEYKLIIADTFFADWHINRKLTCFMGNSYGYIGGSNSDSVLPIKQLISCWPGGPKRVCGYNVDISWIVFLHL